MKRLLLLLALCAGTASAQTLVTANTYCGASPCTISAASSGNTLIGTFAQRTGSRNISTVSSTNTTWTFVCRSTTNVSVEIWYGVVSGGSSGTSVTVTYGTGALTDATISEWSGLDASPVDGTCTANGGTSANPTTGNYTSANAADVLIAWVGGQAATTPTTPTNSFNQIAAGSGGSGGNTHYGAASYRIVSSTGTYSTGWTVASTTWRSLLIGFKAAGSPSTSIKDMIGRGIIPVAR